MLHITLELTLNERSNDMSNITGAQIRAARSLIRWRAEDLANASGVGIATIRRAELVDGVVTMTGPNVAAVQRAIEAAGVEFTNGGNPGVRMRDLKPGDNVRYEPNGKVGAVIDRPPNMGGMIWVEFRDGPMSVERGRLVLVSSASV